MKEIIVREEDTLDKMYIPRIANRGKEVIIIPEWIIRIIKEGDIDKLKKMAGDSKQFNK